MVASCAPHSIEKAEVLILWPCRLHRAGASALKRVAGPGTRAKKTGVCTCALSWMQVKRQKQTHI